jgi:nucleoside-diphosphate kinase
MVKPDGVQRGLVGNVISRFENKGFQIIGLKMYQTSKEVAEEHYKDLKSKPFYGKLVDYIVSGPVVCIVRSLVTVILE